MRIAWIHRNKRMVPRLLEAVYGSERRLAGGGQAREEDGEKKILAKAKRLLRMNRLQIWPSLPKPRSHVQSITWWLCVNFTQSQQVL